MSIAEFSSADGSGASAVFESCVRAVQGCEGAGGLGMRGPPRARGDGGAANFFGDSTEGDDSSGRRPLASH